VVACRGPRCVLAFEAMRAGVFRRGGKEAEGMREKGRHVLVGRRADERSMAKGGHVVGCTRAACSGARGFHKRVRERARARA
jgi:hypothetical protein